MKNAPGSGIGFVPGRQRGNYDFISTSLIINHTITSAKAVIHPEFGIQRRFPRSRCASAIVQTRLTAHWPLAGIERIKATMDFMSCAFMLVRGMPPFCIWIL
jgi:acid phosphatase class B